MIAIHFIDKKCPRCRKDVDVWDIATSILDKNPIRDLMDTILDFAGFKGMIGSIGIRPFLITTINLHDQGLPEDAVIIRINYTPEGSRLGTFPLEMHGNTPNRNFVSPKLSLYGSVGGLSHTEVRPGEYGADISKVDLANFTKVNVYIIYMSIENLDLPAEYLYYAANEYLKESWREMIINVSIAAEVSVSRVCESYWLKVFKGSDVEKLQKTDYRTKLFYHLPLAAHCVGENKIDKPIRKALQELLEHRNQLMHLGNFKTKPPIKQLNKMIMAVFFLREYTNKLIDKLKA